jgi:hypothetical protein
MRPNEWDSSDTSKSFVSGGGSISNTYKTDYPREYDIWDRGGFRYRQTANKDYSQFNNYDTQFAKPLVGFTETTKFCSRIVCSLKRNISEQNDPNLKTFLSMNVFDISDNMGSIKYLYDNNSEKGNNLFAITERGICLLITDKRIVSQIDGGELFALPADKLVTGEHWLNKNTGSNNEFWRGMAEYNNTLFIPNSESVYMLRGMELIDIGRNNKGGYYSKLKPILTGVGAGFSTKMSGAYDILNEEYWLSIGDKVYVFKNSNDTMAYTGTYDYIGDKFLGVKGYDGLQNIAMLSFSTYVYPPSDITTDQYRNTFKLNEGLRINREPINGMVEFVVSPEGYVTKEFIDQTYNCSLQPDTVKYTTNEGSFEGIQSSFRNYTNSYYTMIPRKSLSLAGNTYRFQNQYILCRVECASGDDFIINSVETGYKILK